MYAFFPPLEKKSSIGHLIKKMNDNIKKENYARMNSTKCGPKQA